MRDQRLSLILSCIFSEEDFVDCSQKYGNAGCNGGLALRAWNYAATVGVNTASAYPYQGEVYKLCLDSFASVRLRFT